MKRTMSACLFCLLVSTYALSGETNFTVVLKGEEHEVIYASPVIEGYDEWSGERWDADRALPQQFYAVVEYRYFDNDTIKVTGTELIFFGNTKDEKGAPPSKTYSRLTLRGLDLHVNDRATLVGALHDVVCVGGEGTLLVGAFDGMRKGSAIHSLSGALIDQRLVPAASHDVPLIMAGASHPVALKVAGFSHKLWHLVLSSSFSSAAGVVEDLERKGFSEVK